MAQPNFKDALATITAFKTQLVAAGGIGTQSIEDFKNFTGAFSNLTNFDATKIAKNLTAFATINSSTWNGLSTALSALTPILTRLGTTTVVEDGARALSTLSSALVGFTEIKFSKLTASIGKLLFFNTLISLPSMLGRVTNAFTKLGVMIAGLADPAIAAGAEALKDIGIGLTSLQNISFGKLIKSIFSVWALMPLLRGLFNRLKELAEILKDPASTDGAKNLDQIAKSLTTLGEVKWGKILIGTWAINRLTAALGNFVPELEKMGTRDVDINKGVIALMDVAEAVGKFGSFKVFAGAINMAIVGPAMIFLSAGVRVLGAVSSLMDTISEPLKALATACLSWSNPKLFISGLVMMVVAAGLIAIALGGALLGMVSPLIYGAAIALEVLGAALNAFGGLAANPFFWLGILALGILAILALELGIALVLAGIGAILLAVGLTLLIIPLLLLGMMSPLIILAAFAIGLLSIAIAAFAVIMVFSAPMIVIATILLVDLGIAMLVAGAGAILLGVGLALLVEPLLALGEMAGSIAWAALAMVALGVAIAAFSFIMMASSPSIIYATWLLGNLAEEVFLLGIALMLISNAGGNIADSIQPFLNLSDYSDKLLKAARAIAAVGEAVAKFRSATSTGLLSRLANFFGFSGDDTIMLLKELGEMSTNLDKTARALERILSAASGINELNIKKEAAKKIQSAATEMSNDAIETGASTLKTKAASASASIVNSVVNNSSSNPSTVINNFGVNHGERTSGLFGLAMTGAA